MFVTTNVPLILNASDDSRSSYLTSSAADIVNSVPVGRPGGSHGCITSLCCAFTKLWLLFMKHRDLIFYLLVLLLRRLVCAECGVSSLRAEIMESLLAR